MKRFPILGLNDLMTDCCESETYLREVNLSCKCSFYTLSEYLKSDILPPHSIFYIYSIHHTDIL